MTRQKKEIIKKIDEIERFIRAEEELGCGFAPAEWSFSVNWNEFDD